MFYIVFSCYATSSKEVEWEHFRVDGQHDHILSHIITYYHILSHIITYYHILSHIITYYHILSHIITYYHILSPSFQPQHHVHRKSCKFTAENTHRLTGSFVLIRWIVASPMVQWFSDYQWFVASLFHYFHWFIDILDRSLVLWFTGSLICWFVDSLIHWFTDSLIGWILDSSVRSVSCA